MENPEINLKKWSVFKKVLLFLSVSAYRASVNSPFKTFYQRKSRQMSFAANLNAFFFIAIYNIIFSARFPIPDQYHVPLIMALILYFGATYIFYDKDIVVASVFYNHYYNNTLYIFFWLYKIIGVVCGVMMFYNAIGK